MKKSMLILGAVLVTFGSTAFVYQNWSHAAAEVKPTTCTKTVVFDRDPGNIFHEQADVELFYNVAPRFNTTITKEDLQKAKSIIDILPENATSSREEYQNVRVSILHDDHDATEMGENEMLNSAQKNLLQSVDYSTNIRITSICQKKYAHGQALRADSLVYYMTIIPEKEAAFTSGHCALIQYLKDNTRDLAAVISRDQLRPGKVSFTVTKNGMIANVHLTDTSGYSSVDEALVERIRSMPGEWAPATNAQGEKVDQEFVFFFGLEGC